MNIDVVMVRWPAEHGRLAELRAQGVPRLLMVAEEAPPPDPHPGLEDWIRLPAQAADVRVRVDGLTARARDSDELQPVIEPGGRVRFRGLTADVSPGESLLLGAMVDRFGQVVSRDVLATQIGGDPTRNALDAAISRLRRRVEPLGVELTAVRRRGYKLTVVRQDSVAGA